MEKRIKRVYPIRTTRNKWKIPLFCRHTCNENCNILVLNDYDDDNDEEYILLEENPDYKDGKCSFSGKVQNTYVRLGNFDEDNPLGDTGPLYEPDMKVILDNSFMVYVYFPLSHVLEVTVTTPSSNGFTLKELIYSLKTLYTFIYTEEERTASPQVYPLRRVCSSCGNKDISEYIKEAEEVEKPPVEENCCICYCDYSNTDENNITAMLKCKHIFHKDCIQTWLRKSGTCPICRNNIFECNNCNGTGIICYNFTGIVIPVELRGQMLNRNETFGRFGIHSFDLEDLLVESLIYDNVKKQLFMNITT